MHIVCTSHAHRMYITCTSHAHRMYITCTYMHNYVLCLQCHQYIACIYMHMYYTRVHNIMHMPITCTHTCGAALVSQIRQVLPYLNKQGMLGIPVLDSYIINHTGFLVGNRIWPVYKIWQKPVLHTIVLNPPLHNVEKSLFHNTCNGHHLWCCTMLFKLTLYTL